uniref:Uncharacterized protein n=1 Tax=Desertifilum tharense IPPAS B-1220 TaxID=1781255 RepID=A0ACD5GXE8_9CYAN
MLTRNSELGTRNLPSTLLVTKNRATASHSELSTHFPHLPIPPSPHPLPLSELGTRYFALFC